MPLTSDWSYARRYAGGVVPSLTIPTPDTGILQAITNIASGFYAFGTGTTAPTLTVVQATVTLFSYTLAVNAPAGTLDRDSFDLAVKIEQFAQLVIAWNVAVPAGGIGWLKVDGYVVI